MSFDDQTALKDTLGICIDSAKHMNGSDDPNFKRIHHVGHHIVLYIKDYIMKEDCKNYMEIGTHFGHSLSTVLQSKYPSKFVSVDLFQPGRTIAPDCKVKNVEQLANSNAEKFNVNGYDCTILKGSSYANDTVAKVKKLMPSIDLLFIDGDHRYDAVIKDFEQYLPLVSSGGYIVFDDYLPLHINGKARGCPQAIDFLVKKHSDKIIVIGQIPDDAGANKYKNLDIAVNCSFIVKKR